MLAGSLLKTASFLSFLWHDLGHSKSQEGSWRAGRRGGPALGGRTWSGKACHSSRCKIREGGCLLQLEMGKNSFSGYLRWGEGWYWPSQPQDASSGYSENQGLALSVFLDMVQIAERQQFVQLCWVGDDS